MFATVVMNSKTYFKVEPIWFAHRKQPRPECDRSSERCVELSFTIVACLKHESLWLGDTLSRCPAKREYSLEGESSFWVSLSHSMIIHDLKNFSFKRVKTLSTTAQELNNRLQVFSDIKLFKNK